MTDIKNFRSASENTSEIVVLPLKVHDLNHIDILQKHTILSIKVCFQLWKKLSDKRTQGQHTSFFQSFQLRLHDNVEFRDK